MVRSLNARPICAVCNVPVAEMLEEEDPTFRRVTFTAVCHGARERVTLDEEVAGSMKIMGFGFAFTSTPRRLPPAP